MKKLVMAKRWAARESAPRRCWGASSRTWPKGRVQMKKRRSARRFASDL
ncbi:hypothetical protein CES86_1199 [Brucella lupini]|uniref:Uncharacterized protein n=1 Tax=Brucella lupini TaxID=255457 RepID=A0A256GXJ4_9HYPH|nr:hypothetical protein CES86_1199 [Brucella lupini]